MSDLPKMPERPKPNCFVKDCGGTFAHTAGQVTAYAEAMEEGLAEAEAVIAKLPKTADGVVVVPGMEVWVHGEGDLEGVCVPQQVHPSATWLMQVERFEGSGMLYFSRMYSTREAAQAAKGDSDA